MSNINVTIATPAAASVKIKPKKSVVSSVQVGPRTKFTLDDLIDVSAAHPEDGYALVYDETAHEYVVKPVVVNSNNITSIQGGQF